MIISFAATAVLFLPIYGDPNYKIPSWIKETAGFWADEKISDADFVQSLTYLIENKIITIPQLQSTQNLHSAMDVNNGATSYVSDRLTVSLFTNKKVFGPNDNIMIFGTVSKVVPNHDVGVVISDSSGQILSLAKITPNPDGSYGFVAQEPRFREFGQYSVNAYYGGQAFAHTTYQYNPVNKG